ncbi:hypothetical protein V8B97DRAFT_2110570 [Scleroderma yunnanense]
MTENNETSIRRWYDSIWMSMSEQAAKIHAPISREVDNVETGSDVHMLTRKFLLVQSVRLTCEDDILATNPLSSIMQSQRGGTSRDPPSAPQPPPPLVHFNGTADGSKMDSRMVVGLAGIGFMCRRVKVIGRLKLQWQRTDSLHIGLIPSSLTEDTAKPQYLH